MNTQLGILLKAILQEKGLSVTGAAQLAGISVSNLSRILNGQVSPAFTTVLEIARALDVPLARLGGGLGAEMAPAVAQIPALEAVFGLENIEISANAAGDLLLQAAQGGPVGWAGKYVAADVPQVRLLEAKQVGTNRIEVGLAFPHTVLEAGSIASVLSVASSALAGTGARLLDVRVPEILLRTLSGPALGLRTLQDRFNKHGRPLLACTIRPMQGLSARMYGRAVYEALAGGVDFTADPTLLHSVAGNNWRERYHFAAEAAAAASRDTNERKNHMVNITAATVEEMALRIEFARDYELDAVLVDSAAIGWSALQSVAKLCADKGLALCAMGNRALAGEILPEQLHAKLLRLAGADVVSTGSPLRGNVSNRRYMAGVFATLREDAWAADREQGHYLPQTMAAHNPSLPAVGGGHNPWHFARLLDAVGQQMLVQCGGAAAGHPAGLQAGANACRVAMEALVQARNEGQNLTVDGRNVLLRASKYSAELKQALDVFQDGSLLFGLVYGQGAARPTAGSVVASGSNPSPNIVPLGGTTVTPFKRPEVPPTPTPEPTHED